MDRGLTQGQVIRHRVRRTVTEADNLLASTLIMSTEPLQLDRDFAAATSPSGERLFNSVFTLALMVGLSSHDIDYDPAADAVLLEATLPAPVRIGDTLRAETEVVGRDAAAGRALLRHRAYRQDDVLVASALRDVGVLAE